MVVAVLGLGRLGHTLAILLPRAGIPVRGWRRGEPLPPADVYWICVRDTAIAEVAAAIPIGSGVVLHASGALGPGVLANHADHAVLHPLMTFPGPETGIPDLRGVGAAVAGPARSVAETLARALGMIPFPAPSDTRRYHAAATMASGHPAAAFLDAVLVLGDAGVPHPAERLLPLALESLRRVAASGGSALTGPAARRDGATIAAHEAVLDGEIRELYRLLTRRILFRTGGPSDRLE